MKGSSLEGLILEASRLKDSNLKTIERVWVAYEIHESQNLRQ